MKVYEKLMEIQGVYSENVEEIKKQIVNDAYKYRMWIIDLLDCDKYSELHDTVDEFLLVDEHYDGDEMEAWKRFLEFDVFGG